MRITCSLVCFSDCYTPVAEGRVCVITALVGQKIRKSEDSGENMFLPVTDAGDSDEPFVLFGRGHFSKDKMAISKKTMTQKAVVAQMPVGWRKKTKILQLCPHTTDFLIGERLHEG